MSDQALTLIVPGGTTEATSLPDRGGGVQHTKGPLFGRFFAKETKVELQPTRQKLESTLAEARELLGNIQTQQYKGWELEEVTFGLAVSAEGSIGFATAGIESTIELKFSRKQEM
jgi:hypothetical protein